MRVLCSACYARDRRRPATNLDHCRAYHGSTPLCDSCSDDAGQAQLEREFSAYHGGSSWGDSAQIERARLEGAIR